MIRINLFAGLRGADGVGESSATAAVPVGLALRRGEHR